jgi:hypothetical protein
MLRTTSRLKGSRRIIRCIFYMARQPPQWARTSSFTRFLCHSVTHCSRWDSSGRVISPTQRPLPDNTQHSQQKTTHDPGAIRTTIPADERPQTYTVDRATTGTGIRYITRLRIEFENLVNCGFYSRNMSPLINYKQSCV